LRAVVRTPMSDVELQVDGFRIQPLSVETWDAFADLAERHNGVWGGCWCAFFHCYPDPPERKTLGNREFKRQRVEEDRAHAALVFDGDTAIAWAEFGPVEELPNIHHRKQYDAEAVTRPDFRITCIYVDKRHRKGGLAAVALRGALDLIAQAGGGLVEGYPQDTPGKKINPSFLYNGTRHLYEEAGFRYDRAKGKNHCVMTRTVEAAD
jgi:GNAT superfamily N-acetyltransferase